MRQASRGNEQVPYLLKKDERAAMAMDELASALDAGLTAADLARTAGADLDETMVATLQTRGVELSESERVIFQAAADSGSLPQALRERARSRRDRAELVRTLVGRLAYPAFVLLVATAVAILVGSLAGDARLPILVGVFPLAVAALVWWAARRGFRRVSGFPLNLRPVGLVFLDLGELPYLQTLRGLYAAGVPLLQAHPQAVRAVGVSLSNESI